MWTSNISIHQSFYILSRPIFIHPTARRYKASPVEAKVPASTFHMTEEEENKINFNANQQTESNHSKEKFNKAEQG